MSMSVVEFSSIHVDLLQLKLAGITLFDLRAHEGTKMRIW
jgi:hypothetical protein